jgi:putative transposase
MDFVHDQLPTGRKIRVLTVDTYTRYALAIVPRFSFKAAKVVTVLDAACAELG